MDLLQMPGGESAEGFQPVSYTHLDVYKRQDFYSERKNRFGVHKQVLHARQLGFIHPVTGEYMEFTREPDEVFLKILETLRKTKKT